MTLWEDEVDDAFVWQDYLEAFGAEEVPNALFQHVEKSIESSLQPGLYLEVADKNDPNKYWPAIIKMNCGALLSVSYVGPKGVHMPKFWVDIGKVDVQPLGWCEQQKLSGLPATLDPPNSLKEQFPDEDWPDLVKNATANKLTVPVETLNSEGHTPIERLKVNMRVEVQDEHNPYHHWTATIKENVGGRLRLSYDLPENYLEQPIKDFWLFYLSPRLYKLGWADEKGKPWEYQPPSILSASTDDEGVAWGAVLDAARESKEQFPPPADLFEGESELECNLFEVGMKLESINPTNRIEICPATVIQTFPSGHFSIQIDSISGTEMPPIKVCTPQDPYIFPIGWSQSNNIDLTPPSGWTSEKEKFDWDEYLSTTMSRAAPNSCFVKAESALDMGFEVGQKLEAIDPENEQNICAATITRTLDHLLWIHLDCYDDSKPCIIISATSLDIFPVGWCGSNSYPLKPPLDFHEVCKREIKAEEDELQAAKTTESSSSKSSWCPKIYFNHKCFTGPYLSKGKIALLPKFVGPGPISLVLKEVLSQLISTAYKSRQVLKELTCTEKVPANMHLQMLKAKLKTAIFSANVAIATSADQVEEYCKSVCLKLQSCPYLFGPNCNEGDCPVNCSKMSKSQFTSYWSKKTKHGVPIDGRRRGRKKKQKLIQDEEAVENGKEEESDQSSHGDAEYKEKPKKTYPAFEMRTRKAKLPNFALLGSSWVWGSDEMEEQVPAKRRKRGPSTESQKLANVAPAPVVLVSSQEGIVRKRGRPRLDRGNCKMAAIAGLTNPFMWSKEDVSKYLKRTHDCGCLADRLEAEDIDGKAFMLLNLPTLLENFKFKILYAIKLCQHIELVKYAYLTEYCKSETC